MAEERGLGSGFTERCLLRCGWEECGQVVLGPGGHRGKIRTTSHMWGPHTSASPLPTPTSEPQGPGGTSPVPPVCVCKNAEDSAQKSSSRYHEVHKRLFAPGNYLG